MEERFYVTIVRAEKRGFLAGPFADKDAADKMVRPASDKAIKLDPWARFDAFGVTKISLPIGRVFPAGVLNRQLEI